MFNLNDQAVRGGNFSLEKAGLVIGGTTSKAKIDTDGDSSGAFHYIVDGVWETLAYADNNVVLPTETLAEDYTNIFLVGVNAAGTVEVVSGTAVLTAALDDGSVALPWPSLSSGYCPVGAILINAGDSGAFLVNTDALSGGSETVNYIDLFSVPAEPITASAT